MTVLIACIGVLLHLNALAYAVELVRPSQEYTPVRAFTTALLAVLSFVCMVGFWVAVV